MYNLPPRIADRLDSGQFANLHTFLIVARYKSFSRAADELCLTTSAVSHRIKRLEIALGRSLFIRLTRKIALTAEGERLFLILQRTMGELADALEPASEERVEGRITVYARPSVAACWLVPQLAGFSDKYPGVSVDLRVGNEALDFRSQNIDLAIDYSHGPFPGLVSHRLMDESTAPVCSPEYAEAHALIGRPLNIVQCILLHDSLAWNHASHDAEWALWCTQNIPGTVLPHRTYTFDRSDLCIVAAVNHLGIAMGRRHLVQSHIDNGGLVLPFGSFSQSGPYSYYVVHQEGVLPRRTAVFLAWLRRISHNE
ncbi:DNA-binding transcriptional regulator DsdC [Paraburkholderia aspalathi]|uniref:LysR family transcriptional regulator, D-serine deaminase activator n=1 Tax=Paraburkholderia aspalathi TaxID=1324617 RepID=A0A1I6YGW4_9BURK|nr:DNA-binding transcriptional regulator DsdC [Paraburkholderia aspalathi]SFT49484.1 LysR family transcriptional regulator, D-serine deaminase activator [Paraburkholderia aspalathi]